MCGIAGVLGLGIALNEQDERTVRDMLAALRHRGPDGQGVLCDERAVLGNTRLRIIDFSPRADLPMSSADSCLWLAYNGEVTNFLALKKELDAQNSFRSSSDSEVLLHLYQESGIALLQRLTGMFAFCLYDRDGRKAYIVRDFFGLKPVFYREHAGRLYFASEIKALLETPELSGEIDEEAIGDYFSLAYIPGAATPFKDIRELPGGHMLEVDLCAGRWKQTQYYHLRHGDETSITESEAAEKVRSLMLDSVRRNLVSDTPVGLTLSGGVDTTSLLALTRELGRNRELHAFSIKMAEPSFDESSYQDLAVAHIPCRHHTVTVGPDEVLQNLVASTAYMDEPSGDGAVVPLYLLAQEAKKHVSVLLFGEGGDEVFNAYETHRACHVRAAYRRWVPAPARALLRALVPRLPTSYSKLSLEFRLKRFIEGAELSVPESHLFWRHVFTEEEKAFLMPRSGPAQPTSDLFTAFFNGLDCPRDIDKISQLDLRYYFVDDLMVKDDRMSMASSLEGRFPYMDRPLVEFAASLPARMRLKGFRGRHIQKLAMKGLLPGKIFRRQGMGLEMPHSIWFLKEFQGLAARYFAEANVRKSRLLNPEAVTFFWNQHLRKKKDYGRPLWCILNYLIWLDLYVHSRDYKKYLRPHAG